jgi:hypothetical protein
MGDRHGASAGKRRIDEHDHSTRLLYLSDSGLTIAVARDSCQEYPDTAAHPSDFR